MMKHLYSLSGGLFASLLRLSGALGNNKARLIVEGRRATLDRLRQGLDNSRPVVWFHVASLGEFEQGRPIMERIRSECPHYQIVLSFFSPSGYTIQHQYQGADVVVYLPNDTSQSVSAFLDIVAPEMAIFVKYDLWPSMITALGDRGIPTYLISAIFRPDQLFFRWYGRWYLRLLRGMKHIFVQDAASLSLLEGHGVNQVSQAGDTRFDRVLAVAQHPVAVPEVEAFVGALDVPVVVAGSTWPADEVALIQLLEVRRDVAFIIAPHEVEEERVADLMAHISRPAVRYSDLKRGKTPEDYEVIIVDIIGLLSSLYQYATVAYVGGGWGRGIHNTLEAAVYGVPVVTGPRIEKFGEAKQLADRGGLFAVEDANQAVLMMQKFLDNPGLREQAGKASGQYVREHAGATDKIVACLFPSSPLSSIPY